MKIKTKILFQSISFRDRPRVTFYRTWPFGTGEFINSVRYPTKSSLNRLAKALNKRQAETVFLSNGYETKV